MNCSEKGYLIRYGVKEDISSYINTLTFRNISTNEIKTFNVENGLKLGTEDYHLDGELLYESNTYVYVDTSQSGCLDNGYWLVSLESKDLQVTKQSKLITMEIYN